MRAKCYELVKLLINNPSTASNLAEQLDVSVRSLKSYVKEINELYPNTILSSNKGYQISGDNALSIINEHENVAPKSSEERSNFIITKLLNSRRGKPIRTFEFCEILFVSDSTLKKDLRKVRSKLAEFDLDLIIKSDKVSVKGLEKNKRRLLSTILYEESSVNFLNLNSLQSAFVDINIIEIREILLEAFDKYHYFVNDYSLINLILHITIAIVRLQNLNNVPVFDTNTSEYDIKEFPLAKEICDTLSRKYHIHYSDNEIHELALLIASRATSLDYKNITKTDIETYIGTETLLLVNKLIDSINAFYHINLFDDDFVVRFALHIRNLLLRSKNNQFSRNPLADDIKKTSPLIYETSVNVASELKTHTGITINDDEIAYIAFHIGSAIETVENYKEKIRVVFYSPNYYNIHNKVLEFVKLNFEKDIIITSIITDESQIETLKDTDFILTSIPIASATLIPVITISVFPTEADRLTLIETILKIRKEKEKRTFRNYLSALIIPELFEISNTIKDSTTAINYMANKLIHSNFANLDFLAQVKEREQMSSTAFAGVAIPHSMFMNANKTAISVLINRNGILWNDVTVYLVIMMCFKKNERYIFNEIFEKMTIVLTDKRHLNSIIQSENYEEFIDKLTASI